MCISIAFALALGLQSQAQLLVERMADPSFRVREDAVNRVASLGPWAVPVLKKATKAHPDEEVRRRALRALDILYKSPYYTVHPTRFPEFADYPQIGFVVNRLQALYGDAENDLVKYRFETKGPKDPARIKALKERCDTFQRMARHAYRYYHEGLERARGQLGSITMRMREGTQYYVRDLLDSGVSRAEALALVNSATELERNWWLKNSPDKLPPGLK
jgi:hypothetical protein